MSNVQRTSLEATHFQPLPLGSVTPKGWLKRQLEIQADGLTGHLDEFWPDLADNQWLGGANGGWERGPYYADGLVPLAFLLDDEALHEKAEKWVSGFLDSQNEQGWIGPKKQTGDDGYEYDPWPRFVVLKVLRQYYEATNETRIIDSMLAFCRYLSTALDNQELTSWGEYRWADLVVTVHWLYERTEEEWLLDVAATATAQGFDWANHFRNGGNKPRQPLDEITHDSHVVNNAMGIKSPGVRYRQSGRQEDRTAALDAIDHLDTFHGQATGVFTGDEHLGGKSPTRGTELCSVVEYMYSLETLIALFGTPSLSDRLERVAFNALPAAFTPDMWGHQYDQQANQVLCTVAHRHWTNGPDANIFGIAPNFGCCTANFHQGWPKFASHLWMRDGEGLAATAYAPSTVTATVADGTAVTLVEDTRYPFEDSVRLTVRTDTPVEFPLSLRAPSWSGSTRLSVSNGEAREIEPGYTTVERTWSDGDTVELTFTPETHVERRCHGAGTVHRGPLVFSRPIDAEWKQIGGEKPHADWELYPTEPWNHGLAVDSDDLDASIELSTDAPGDRPFSPEGAPVEMTLDMFELPDWTLDGNNAGPVPRSPTTAAGEPESKRLVPYGCTNLRVTEFPLVTSE